MASDLVSEKPLWRRLLDFPLVTMVVALAAAIGAVATALLAVSAFPGTDQETRSLLFAGLSMLAVLAAYKFVIRHLGEEPRDELAFPAAAKEFPLGFLLGFVLFAVIVGSAALADVYNVVGGGGTGDLLRILVIVSLAPGFNEEVIFRGILFRWLEQFGGSWLALLVTSALFGLAHINNPNATWFSSFAIAVEAGLLLGGAYMLTRSLWMPIGLHAAWNFTQGFMFDVPVSGTNAEGLVEARLSGPELLSGGAFGLEASVIALVVATAAGTWLVARAAKRGQVIQPWWVRRRVDQAHD